MRFRLYENKEDAVIRVNIFQREIVETISNRSRRQKVRNEYQLNRVLSPNESYYDNFVRDSNAGNISMKQRVLSPINRFLLLNNNIVDVSRYIRHKLRVVQLPRL